jgi:hypothetical protein
MELPKLAAPISLTWEPNTPESKHTEEKNQPGLLLQLLKKYVTIHQF